MATSSIGVRFYYSLDGVTYTSIGCLTDIDYPGPEHDIKEGTCLSQTDYWKTFFGAFVDAGEASLKIQFAKAMYTVLLGLCDDTSPYWFKFVVPDGSDITVIATCSQWVCRGLIKSGPGLTFPSDGDKVVIPVSIKFSGQPTWTPAP